MEEKAFFIVFKGLSLKQIKPTSLERESLTLITFFNLFNFVTAPLFFDKSNL